MALIPHTKELQREVEAVQQLRRTLHDAYIVEAKAGQRAMRDVEKPPTAMEVRRTVDAPTLQVLKSPNYPFTLCEEAPPSYVPPPVPYDVEGEIDSLKKRVLQVQEDFQRYQATHSRAGASLTTSQVLDFFSHSAVFAEMAWEVSSLQWFYRWVLSHSISHLWNCKEQLEYVLCEHDAGLPQTVEEMDDCLRAHPFSAAVSILDSERQAVVAQERRRLRSVSRTFRDRVPAAAVTAATSCYLSPEEKYMYQEFFNQSEHMLLLLNHTLMLNKANGLAAAAPDGASRGRLSSSQSHGRSTSPESGALFVVNESAIGEMDTAGLAEETLHAVSAEQEVISTLMAAIRERQRRGESFEVSAAERERSRAAQTAVYGCVLSDMSLMAHQMNLTVEFVEHYESWLKLRGYDTHDLLMSELSKRSGGTAWPTLGLHGSGCNAHRHGHFVPPTEAMMRYQRAPHPTTPSEATDYTSHRSPTDARTSLARQLPPPIAASGESTTSLASAPALVAPSPPPPPQQPHRPAASAVDAHVVVSPSSAPLAARLETDSAVANAFYSLLLHTSEAAHDGTRASVAAAAADRGVDTLGRAWLTVSVRHVVLKLLRCEWSAAELSQTMSQTEEALLSVVGRKGPFTHLTAVAAALCVVVQEVARLAVARSTVRSLTAEVPVAVHIPGSVDDYAKAVADAAQPVERQRWGAVLDAVWGQVDPSTAASGGLVFSPAAGAAGPVPSNTHSAVHFLYVESMDIPASPAGDDVATILLRYRLPRMSPAAETSRRVAPTLAAVAEAQPSSRGGLSRYHLARRALVALYELEAKGLLPCFACRVSEVGDVPFTQMIYVAFDDGSTSSVVDKGHVPHLCMLPPAAMELRRVHAAVGTAPTESFAATYAAPVSYNSIGLLVGGMLEDMAARTPVLHLLYMAAATAKEQAASDIQAGVVPKTFANASTHPTPIACAPTKTRAISIQRESVANRNPTSSRRFTTPLLRHIDDTISSVELSGVGSSVGWRSNNASIDTLASVSTPHAGAAPEPPSTVGRQTQMVGGGTNSPSPSAVRPHRR
ncbi:hypothetical protein NESM_000197100 [Novymonas esmeraldas]|uniref:Uncharacterized protein n=1 Tax=Novymonas esmeraldas TaxID=1808958 RepID=A0AAW0F8T0_9TRYP